METWRIEFTDGSHAIMHGDLEHPIGSKFMTVNENDIIKAIINLDKVKMIVLA